MTFAARSGQREQTMGSIVHLELHTRDESEARDYYQQLCGWPSQRIEAGNGSYLALAFGNGLGGGIVECGTQRALWLPYVGVERIDQATERAQDLGATVLLPPREGPAGWRSVVRSQSGAELALWQQKR
jgi:predicted enzyme related to lactoylglutathione lyase